MLGRRRAAVKVLSEKLEKRVREDVGVLRLAFPDDQNLPPSRPQRFDIPHITVHVPLKFGLPELSTRFRNAGLPAFRMLMPEAAMHENRSSS